jgi:hypothetical protein
VHRATVHASLELLVERSVLNRAANGRFISNPPPQTGSGVPATVGARLAAAADIALNGGISETAFTELAQRLFRVAAMRRVRVVYVEAGVQVPGMGPNDLSTLLDYPVITEHLDSVQPSPNTVFVTLASYAPRVRAALGGLSDVFAIGLTLDTDLRLAVAGLPLEASVAVVAEDSDTLSAVTQQLEAMRGDLSIEGSLRLGSLTMASDLLLLPESMRLGDSDRPIAHYRCAISLAELTFVRARLPGAINEPAEGMAHSTGTDAELFSSK